MGALWHPFSNMSMVEKNGEFTLVRGEGCYVFDSDGKRYLDATAGLWYANVGHGRDGAGGHRGQADGVAGVVQHLR